LIGVGIGVNPEVRLDKGVEVTLLRAGVMIRADSVPQQQQGQVAIAAQCRTRAMSGVVLANSDTLIAPASSVVLILCSLWFSLLFVP